jgi:hypothetical protein
VNSFDCVAYKHNTASFSFDQRYCGSTLYAEFSIVDGDNIYGVSYHTGTDVRPYNCPVSIIKPNKAVKKGSILF